MKNNFLSKHLLVVIPVAILSTLPLLADGPREIAWNQLCDATRGQELSIATSTGDTVSGYCVSVNVNEVEIKTKDYRVVKIARAGLTRIQMHLQTGSKGHQLRALGRGLHKGFRDSFGLLFSPSAMLGMVAVPAVAVWGAVSAPFCALGDLGYKLRGESETQEIKVL